MKNVLHYVASELQHVTYFLINEMKSTCKLATCRIRSHLCQNFQIFTNPLNLNLMPDSFSPTTGSFITLTQAQSMVAAWVTLQGNLSMSVNEANPKAHAFGADRIQEILDQTGCKGIRAYNGYYDLKRNLIFIGVDEDGNDMTSGQILEFSTPCPPNCAPTTALY